MGRKINTTITPASGIGGTISQSFQYNGLAQSTFARDTVGTTNADVTLVYDSIGRTVEEAQAYGGNTRYVTNTAFTSTPASQFTFPSNRQVRSSFDLLYRRQQVLEQSTGAVIANWQYFGPNRIAEVALGNGIIQTMLNNARTHSAVQFNTVPNPAWGTPSSDRLGYDGSGRMIAKRYLAGGINSSTFAYNTTPVVGNTTAFDPADNKFYERALHAEERSFLYQPVDNNGVVASPQPGYDSINRLLQYQRGTLSSTGGYQNSGGGSVAAPITMPGSAALRTYDLDGLGNWKLSGAELVSSHLTFDQRNHNKLNEITQRTVGTSPVASLRYDGHAGASNGNLANDGTALTYAYDSLNRPISIGFIGAGPRPPQQLGAYVLDAFNRRVRKTVTNSGLSDAVPNGTTDYLYMGNQVIEERNPFGGSGSTDTPTKQYIWGAYVDECAQLNLLAPAGPDNLSAGVYYLLQDLLYRAVALTNSTGNIVEAYDTDAYGTTVIFTAPYQGNWWSDDDTQSYYGANEIIYCGYRYDPESELYYVRNRTYSPPLGRWLQRDPIGYAGGVNLYEYVGGQAVVGVDPKGLVESYVTHEGIQIGHPRVTMGPWVRLPACPNGIAGCCVARTGTYEAFLGTVVTGGNPSQLGGGLIEQLIKAAVKGVANLVPETKLISLWTDDLSFSGVLYIYDMYAVWGRTVIYSYCCGTDFQNPKLISDKRTTPTLISMGANRSAADQNNLYLGGTSGESKKHFMESLWDMFHELVTTVKGE